MEHSECRYESEIIRAARTGQWTEEQRGHLASCESCQGTALISSSLAEIADMIELPTSLPDARLLWLKARVIRQQKRSATLELCLSVGAAAVGVLASVAVLIWVYLSLGPGHDAVNAGQGHGSLGLLWGTLPFLVTGGIIYGLRLLNPSRARMRGLI